MLETGIDPPSAPRGGAVRWFGRLQLLRLLGKSDRTMAWRAIDPSDGCERLLVLPRKQPGNAASVELWRQSAQRAARLNHPHIAAVLQVGVQDGWPYIAYDGGDMLTLGERAHRQGMPGAEAAGLAAQLLQGLAFAHDAGFAHHDLQPYLVVVTSAGHARLAGLAVADGSADSVPTRGSPQPVPHAQAALRVQREAAERDVLAAGIVLHAMITGASALDEPDCGRVIARLPPSGREIVRLPWTTSHPIAEPLRAIVNRATDRQERHRYRSPRTLLRALEGWLQTDAAAGGGPLALLSDKLRSAGVLPSSPGAAARAAQLALMESQRTNELAEIVLDDVALSFEMLRLVNAAQGRGARLGGNGPVLTVRRAIAMLGLDGVRRSALVLRKWPGPLGDDAAAELDRLLERCKRAGRAALALRPGAYDGEVVYLITLLQNLGRLVVHYHFADEAQQIRRLMLPAASPRPGEPDDPGMTEEQASFAVLGADIEAIGTEVARWWGLDDGVLALIRRLPLATPVRGVEGDDEMLRAIASCANEAADALSLPPSRVAAAMQRIVQRYGRLLDCSVRDLHDALQDDGGSVSARAAGPLPPMQATSTPSHGSAAATSAGGLRTTAAARGR